MLVDKFRVLLRGQRGKNEKGVVAVLVDFGKPIFLPKSFVCFSLTEEWEIVRGALPALYSSALLSGGPGTLAGGVTVYILYCGFCIVDTGRLSIGLGDDAKDDVYIRTTFM